MSIASLFKPVDSSKTRLPRTDVLERVAKYADGKSVVSNYFDISTDELIKMLRNDLVPASEVEYVSDIVRTRLSGETTATPKKSVGETISTKPIKEFTVSDPTKDFITLEDIIGPSSAPSGFERGNYLESLIGSGTTGGPTQRGTPAKGAASVDSVDFERGKYLESLIGSGTMGGPTQRGTPAADKSVDPRIFTKRPTDPYIESGQTAGMDYNPRVPAESVDPRIFTTRPTDPYVEPPQTGGMSYTPEAPEDSAPIRQAALGSAEDRQNALDFLKKNQAVIDYYSKQRGEDPTRTTTVPTESVDPKDFTARPVDPYVEPRQTGGMSYTPQTPTESVDPRIFTTRPVDPNVDPNIEPPTARNNDRGVGGPTVGSEFDKRGLVGAAQYLFSQPPSGPIDREVTKNRQYTPSDSALKNAITGLVYGSEGVAEAKRAPEEELKRRAAAAGDVTTDRMAAREAGISALPSSTGGAAGAGTGGVAPRGVDPTGIGRDSTPTPAFVAGTDPTRVTSAPSTSSQPSATPTADRAAPVIPDTPTKDEKNDIKKAANEVAKNPSVGGIQSLFEQAGFSDALLQLGLGMMASKNPDFLGALGESGQSAVALMAKQREEAKKAKLEADKMILEERRVAAQEADVKNRGDADKTPAGMKSSKYLADATIIAKKQKEAGQYGTAEQLYVMNQTRSDIASIAEKAGQSASNNWQSGMNKILAMDAGTKREKEARAAALDQYYKTNGSNTEEAYNQGITRSLGRLDPEGLLSIGIAPVQNTVQKYDVATGTIIK